MQTMTYNTTKLRFNSKILLALGVLLSASTASYACDSCQIMLAAQQHQTFQTHIYKSMNDSNAKRHRDGSNSAERSTSKAQPNSNAAQDAPTGFTRSKSRPSIDDNPLPYIRDPALSTKLREEFLANIARNSPNTVDRMRASTQQTDFVQLTAAFIQMQGLDSGSMENLIAFWYGQSWAIVHQKKLPTAEQYQAIAAQVQRHFDKSTTFKSMSNAARQTLFEQLTYPLFVEKAKYADYLKQGNTATLSKMAASTQDGFKKLGLDLQNLQLTSRGLAPL
jgi:hypothetical protein